MMAEAIRFAVAVAALIVGWGIVNLACWLFGSRWRFGWYEKR